MGIRLSGLLKASQYETKIKNLSSQVPEPTLPFTAFSSDGMKKGKAFGFGYFGTVNIVSKCRLKVI